ncbi:hypothetical protein RCL1_008790 [Eukaryota sp. TZLM3-RCL]
MVSESSYSVSSAICPRLVDVRAESVSFFLTDYSAHVKSAGVDQAMRLKDCVSEPLLDCISLLDPSVLKSDTNLRNYLVALTEYAKIEEAYAAYDSLAMDGAISDPTERVFHLLQEFLAIQKKAKDFGIPDSALLPRFAKAVRPRGLSQSLLTRISDGILSTLALLVETTLDDLLSLERSAGWKRTSASINSGVYSEPPLNKVDRERVFKERLRFKCNQPGHLANSCHNKVEKIESIRYLNTNVSCPPPSLMNPLSLKRGSNVIVY